MELYSIGVQHRNLNQSSLLQEFGGGGHATAASATVHNMTLAQVEQKLMGLLQDSIKPVKVAKDFMKVVVE